MGLVALALPAPGEKGARSVKLPPQAPLGPSGPVLTCIVQNVNGLHSRKKRQAVFMRLRRMHPRPDVALLIFFFFFFFGVAH
jgi:hypothetical protein